MAPNISMKALLETGVHFGHRTRKWNAKMKNYIFAERNGIHILDLQQTLKAVRETYDIVRDTVMEGGTVLFVGSKRQAQDTIAREAARAGMPYVNQRWLGGTLTNWRTIRQRIDFLKQLEARRERGEFDLITKKEALTLTREIDKLNQRLGGIRDMRNLPDLLYIVDVRREHTAVREANILNIPIVAMVDTNCDPDVIDYVIPSNDDAIRAIKLLVSVAADAVLEGINLRKDSVFEEEGEDLDYDYPAAAADDETDEDFLGEATLAKLKSGELSFEDGLDVDEDEEDEEDDEAAEDDTDDVDDEAEAEDEGEEEEQDDEADED